MIKGRLKREPVLISQPCLCGAFEYYVDQNLGSFKILMCTHCGLRRTYPFQKPHYRRDDLYHLEDIQITKGTRSQWFRSNQHILSEVARFKREGRVLDLGCGFGALVKSATRSGFDAIGLEISIATARKGKECLDAEIIIGDASLPCFTKSSFDVVMMSQFLEHVEDVLGILANIRDLLKDRGILAVSVPNYDGFLRRVFGSRVFRRNWPYYPAQHVWHFAPASLCGILLKAGFRPLRIRLDNLDYGQVWPPKLFVDIFKGGKTSVSALIRTILIPLVLLTEWLGVGDNLLVTAMKIKE